MRINRGISLITLMVIVAIVAIVAAVAIPVWQRQLHRGHVDEALKAVDAAKLVVMEAATTRGGLSRVKTRDLAYNSNVTNKYAAKVEIDDGGRITLTTKDTGFTPDPILVLMPSENGGARDQPPIQWKCTMAVGDQSAAPDTCHEIGTAAATAPAVPASTVAPNVRAGA